MDRTPTTEHRPAQDMPAAREFIELWIRLSKAEWRSAIVVPAEPSGSTEGLARALADIGRRLSFFQVTAIVVNALEYGSALALADLTQHAQRAQMQGQPPGQEVVSEPGPEAGPRSEALVPSPQPRIIIAIPSVISEPLGLAAAREADVVAVTVRLGHTLASDVRRTVELIGRERVTGCILVR